jgi:hypothetical protein
MRNGFLKREREADCHARTHAALLAGGYASITGPARSRRYIGSRRRLLKATPSTPLSSGSLSSCRPHASLTIRLGSPSTSGGEGDRARRTGQWSQVARNVRVRPCRRARPIMNGGASPS